MDYFHVDVFTPRPFSGNSLAVFPEADALPAESLALITREMRHFESIFLAATADPRAVKARVFDLIEELDFAGHPILGAASVLHHLREDGDTGRWTFHLTAKTVDVATARRGGHFTATMDQGRAEYLGAAPRERRAEIALALSLREDDLDPDLPLEIVSTGLRYLIVPLRGGDALARARIARPDFEVLLGSLGAQFAYVLDAAALEGRHWNNDGVLEDVATGSGAGTVAAYLVRHGRSRSGEERVLRQGRFVGRPSEIRIAATGDGREVRSVSVGGDVAMVGRGVLDAVPA